MEEEEICSSSSSLLRVHTRVEGSESRDGKISVARPKEGESEEEKERVRERREGERKRGRKRERYKEREEGLIKA